MHFHTRLLIVLVSSALLALLLLDPGSSRQVLVRLLPETLVSAAPERLLGFGSILALLIAAVVYRGKVRHSRLATLIVQNPTVLVGDLVVSPVVANLPLAQRAE